MYGIVLMLCLLILINAQVKAYVSRTVGPWELVVYSLRQSVTRLSMTRLGT
jgi:hypothetical protein